jgi:putative alpha-1,2-mannosidase
MHNARIETQRAYRDINVEEAYQAIRKNATEATLLPWSRAGLTPLDKIYFDKGFFPALDPGEAETVPQVTAERRQAVSVTLENGYDDWSVAQLAKALGKQKDASYFTHLANNYRNHFNPATGFMAPKDANGYWVEPFDPKLGGGQGGRDYFTEVDSWLYTFNVQYDVAGLIDLMGGRDAFNHKLDQLFVEQYGTSKYKFLSQFPDATGLIGLYAFLPAAGLNQQSRSVVSKLWLAMVAQAGVGRNAAKGTPQSNTVRHREHTTRQIPSRRKVHRSATCGIGRIE